MTPPTPTAESLKIVAALRKFIEGLPSPSPADEETVSRELAKVIDAACPDLARLEILRAANAAMMADEEHTEANNALVDACKASPSRSIPGNHPLADAEKIARATWGSAQDYWQSLRDSAPKAPEAAIERDRRQRQEEEDRRERAYEEELQWRREQADAEDDPPDDPRAIAPKS